MSARSKPFHHSTPCEHKAENKSFLLQMLILKKLDLIQQNIDELELFGTLEGTLEAFQKFIL